MNVSIETDFETQDEYDLTLKHADWTLNLCLDTEHDEMIFDVEIVPDSWLAVGISNDWMDADIIGWIAGPVLEG